MSSIIRVMKAPPSDIAPLHITEEWVSIELPVVSENEGGYLVFREKAIEALRVQGKHAAANYWEKLPLGTYLQFKKDCCEVLS